MNLENPSEVSSEKKKKKFKNYKEYELYNQRGKLIKKKQEIESWLQFYKFYEAMDSFKPEKLRYVNSIKAREQWNEINEKLVQIEKSLNLN